MYPIGSREVYILLALRCSKEENARPERTAMAPARVLLVDDSEEFLALASRAIEHLPVRVVGVARCGVEAIAAADALAPDLVLMDVNMPGMNGFEATRQIKARGDARVLMLTLQDAPEFRQAAHEAGAEALVPKTELPARLGEAVAALLPGLSRLAETALE